MIIRTPQSCPYRQTSSYTGSHYCEILSDLLKDDIPDGAVVSIDACEACCRLFQPSTEDINPVIASILWGRANEALANGRSSESSTRTDRLSRLLEFAEANIPAVYGEDDDLPSFPKRAESEHQLSVEWLHQVLPEFIAHGQQIHDWAVGVTTTARRVPTLGSCLYSLAAAGWKSPRLFIDGDVQLPKEAGPLLQTIRRPGMGALANYYHSLAELVDTTEATFLMMVQDDAWWPTHLPVREYLEQIHWPLSEPFVVSAYCCTNDTAPKSGWRQYDDVWRNGAVAMIFSRSAAAAFIADNIVSRYGKTQCAGIDSIIGEWSLRNQIPIYVPTPSLVQHIGDVSTLWKSSRAVGLRRASRFIGDEVIAPTTGEK